MSLLNSNQLVNSNIAECAVGCANHLASAAYHVNKIVTIALKLSNENLSSWLNSRSPQETSALFSAHALLGETVNNATELSHSILSESGITIEKVIIDIRPFAEKLLDQGRLINFEDGVFTVQNVPIPEPPPQIESDTDSPPESDFPIDPEPQQEPLPDPEPEPEPTPEPDINLEP